VLDGTDVDEMAGLFDRLSPASRYLRYLGPVHKLPASWLAHLAAVDHQRHEAVGAFDDASHLVGVVHYFRSADDPTRAEIAAEVADAYQRRGIAVCLLLRLAELARRQGITHFTATTLAENHAALSLMHRAGWPMVARTDGPEVSITLTLAPGTEPGHPPDAAEGRVDQGAMEDLYDLQRFVDAQAPVIAQVQRELRAGQKRSHWIWYVFPQLRGLGHSHYADLYGIGSRDEAVAYWRHPVLGPRLGECVDLVLGIDGRTAHQIFGSPDDLKLRSCLTLFAAAVPDEPRFTAALERYYDGTPDQRTLALLG
jgi:uncharacterized protein (DUF1810 family)/GNAT superfamily N-acetyltransferase